MKPKSITLPLLAGLAAVLLTGCPGRESAQSVQWYIDHPKERTEKLTSCHDEHPQSQDCVNAAQAFNSAPSSLKTKL